MRIIKKPTFAVVTALIILILGYFALSPESRTQAMGVDTNSNGVWDDVEKVIENESNMRPTLRSALLHKARALQAGMLNPERALEFVEQSSLAGDCMELELEDFDEYARLRFLIEASLTNSYRRSKAYISYNAKLSGNIFRIEDVKATACDFLK